MAEFTGPTHFNGGRNLYPGTGPKGERLADLIGDSVSDGADIWTVVRALAAKLDLDVGVTDTDYVAVIDALAPPADIPRNTSV
jgi:hypothetical protein